MNKKQPKPIICDVTSACFDPQAPGLLKFRFCFDEPALTSDGGPPIPAAVEADLKPIDNMAESLTDKSRNPEHTLCRIFRRRVFQTASGAFDANEGDAPRDDPVFRCPAGKAPDKPTAGRPAMSRMENSITKKDLLSLAKARVSSFMKTYNQRG